jgi:hypothetical protein
MTEDVRDEVSTEDQVVETSEQQGDAAAAEGKVAAHIDSVLIRRVLEAAILAADGPLDRDTMLSLFDEAERPDRDSLNLILAELAESYADRGIELKEVASGFRFQVRREMGPWVSRLWQEKAPRYSRAILETLALIAYRSRKFVAWQSTPRSSRPCWSVTGSGLLVIAMCLVVRPCSPPPGSFLITSI